MHYISEFVRASTTEIYSGMVNLSIEAVNQDDTTMPSPPATGVTASIKFEGGFEAVLHMTYSEALAKTVTATMMGVTPVSCTAPEVGDVIGELANMVGGNLKNRMAAKGIAGTATAPVITPNASFNPHIIPGGVSLFNLFKAPAGGELEVRVFAKV